LPGPHDALERFDRDRAVAMTVPEVIDRGTSEQVKELIGLVVLRVAVTDRRVADIEFKPEARSFFDVTLDRVLARPAGLEPTTSRSATWRSIR
jgi:hypothetical protein